MARVARLLVGVGFLFFLPATPGAAQQYPPTGGTLGVSSGTAAPGGSITVSGSGCAPVTDVAFAVDEAPAGDTTSDTAGAFSDEVTMPSDASGSVEVSATCDEADGGVLVLAANVSIQATEGGMPFTGASNTFPTMLGALGVLVLGATLVLLARRRSLALSR